MGITLISQSGTMGIVFYDRISKMDNIEIETLISVGNLAGLGFYDYINHANNDENTDVILIYMEDVKNGKKFISICQNCKKPIVVLKGGRSSIGAKSAASHTGAMAGSDQIYQTAFKQAGVHSVDTIEELFMAAEVFSMCKIPNGNRVGILSPGGGSNISCVDFCEKFNLIIPELSIITRELITKHLPKHAPSPKNPVDTAASFDADDFESIISHMLHDENLDMLIINYVMTDNYISQWEEKYKYSAPIILKNPPIPIIGSWMGNEGTVRKMFEEYIPIFDEPAKAAMGASLIFRQFEYLKCKQ